MKNEHLVFIGIFWVLPILGGMWFSVWFWQFFKRFDYRLAAIFRALAVAVIFTPAYVRDEGFLPFQSSIFLFFSALNGSFLDNALVAIPPIFLVWLFLILIFIFVGKPLPKGKFGLTHPSSGTGESALR